MYLLKIFFSSLERDVLELCFRSLRFGYFFFFPLPFLDTRSEPRFSPVAASMSRISSASRQSVEKTKFLPMKLYTHYKCVCRYMHRLILFADNLILICKQLSHADPYCHNNNAQLWTNKNTCS